MPLFHESVGDSAKNETIIPLPELLSIADQMVSRNHDFNFTLNLLIQRGQLSALQFIHSHYMI